MAWPTKRELAVALHRAGRSENEISRALECNVEVIRKLLAKSGIVPLTHEQLNREIEERRVMYGGGRRGC